VVRSLLRVVKFTVTAAQLSVLVFVFAVQWVVTLCTAANLLLNACTVHEIRYTNWEQRGPTSADSNGGEQATSWLPDALAVLYWLRPAVANSERVSDTCCF